MSNKNLRDLFHPIQRKFIDDAFKNIGFPTLTESLDKLQAESEAAQIETCDCETCQDREKPCAFDCDRDAECAGCKEVREEVEEIQFTIDCQTGRHR